MPTHQLWDTYWHIPVGPTFSVGFYTTLYLYIPKNHSPLGFYQQDSRYIYFQQGHYVAFYPGNQARKGTTGVAIPLNIEIVPSCKVKFDFMWSFVPYDYI